MINSIFPNYIYEYILKNILEYICDRLSVSYYNTNFKNNNEIINYSLVSKIWFNKTKNILSTQLNQKNWNSLCKLIDFPITCDQSNTYQFKIIKLINDENCNNIAINCIFLNEVSKLSNIQDLSKNKILLHSFDYNFSYQIIESINSYPKNYKFNLNVSLLFKSSNKFYYQLLEKNKDHLYKINKMILNDRGDINGLFNLMKYDIKNIAFEDEINKNRNYYFEMKFQSNKNKNFNIDDFVFRYEFKRQLIQKNQSLSKLNKFRYHTTLSSVIDILKTNFLFLRDEQITEEHHQNINFNLNAWNILISNFSKDPTIKRISFMDVNKPFYKGIEKSIIYTGFKTILSSPFTINLKSFSFKLNSGEISPLVLEGIALNKSIINLFINDIHFTSIIERSLIKNKTIRNLFITQTYKNEKDINYIIDGFKLLSKRYNTLGNLYSISIEIQTSNENLNTLIQFIQENYLNINEINISNNYNPLLEIKSISYQMKANNTIINISKF